MVVMLGEVFGQLEMRMVATMYEPPYDSGCDQYRQAAICRTLCQ